MIMTYKETTDYLFNQMPMFERQGASGYKEGLENTLALDTHFGHPHRSYHTIHIGGTNGKGSCSHTISAILQCCGYKVGLYTSPHILDFRERIRINGQPISEEYVVEFVEHERTFFEKMSPSFFEVTTAMALKYFKDMQVDIAVIEVGLGGNLDCTNIISPLVSVITNISYDHTQFLGDTLEKIAAEKAGIIKRGVPVVIGEATEETRHVFEKKARECNTRIVFAEDNPFILEAETTEEGLIYTTRNMGKMVGDLKGIYQEKNANTILAAMNELAKLGYVAEFADNESAAKNTKEIKQAFKCVAELTGLMGRWQKIKDVPLVVCDTGHNPAGWKYISKQLATVKCKQMHIVFGMVDDKDCEGVIEQLPLDAIYYFTKPDNKRGVDEDIIEELAKQKGLNGQCYASVKEAYKAASHNASHDDFIFVGGSTYIVADFLKECV